MGMQLSQCPSLPVPCACPAGTAKSHRHYCKGCHQSQNKRRSKPEKNLKPLNPKPQQGFRRARRRRSVGSGLSPRRRLHPIRARGPGARLQRMFKTRFGIRVQEQSMVSSSSSVSGCRGGANVTPLRKNHHNRSFSLIHCQGLADQPLHSQLGKAEDGRGRQESQKNCSGTRPSSLFWETTKPTRHGLILQFAEAPATLNVSAHARPWAKQAEEVSDSWHSLVTAAA